MDNLCWVRRILSRNVVGFEILNRNQENKILIQIKMAFVAGL